MVLTNQNLLTSRDEIKAIASQCTGTPTAKLIAILEAAGITSSAEIAVILGVAIRTVQHARRASKNATHCAHVANASATYCAEAQPIAPQPIAPNATHCANTQPVAPRARVLDNNIISLPVDRLVREVITPLSPPLADAKPKREPKTKRGSRLPDDWALPDDWREWVRVNCPAAGDAAIDREALKFANFWQAKAGQNAAKLDWRKTWQNWCLTAFATAPVRNPMPAAAQPGRARAALERMLAEAAT